MDTALAAGASNAKTGAAGAEDHAAREHIVRAAGGAKALKAVNAIRAEGEITAFARGDSGRYVRVWARGRKLRVETTYTRSTELRLLDGTRGWRGADEHSLSEAKGAWLNSMLYQYLVADLPFGLADGRFRLSYVGKDLDRGKQVDVFRLMEPASPEVFVFVDAEGHVVKSKGVFTIGSGTSAASTALSAEFSDFRKVDDLVLPYTVTFFAQGMKIAMTTIERYELNPKTPAALFEPPRQ